MVQYPDDSGVALQPGRVLIAQVHYNLYEPSNRGLSDQTVIRMQLRSQVENIGLQVLMDPLVQSLDTAADHIASRPSGDASQSAALRNGLRKRISNARAIAPSVLLAPISVLMRRSIR